MSTLVFACCFLALAALAGLAAASGTHALLRLPVVALTPLLALAVWWQLSQRDGWPAPAHPAEGSEFVAGLVRAPTPGDAGAVYLWTQPPGSTTPRAYRLPYSPDLEQQVAHAARASKKGAHVAVHMTRRGRKSTSRGAQAPSSGMRFVRLPPAPIAEKDETTRSAAG